MPRKPATPADAAKAPAKKPRSRKKKHPNTKQKKPRNAKGQVLGGEPVYDRVKLFPLILAQLIDGVPLAVICKGAGMPSTDVVDEWRKDQDLDAKYHRARSFGFDSIAADCLRIADTTQIGERRKFTEDGGEEVTQEDMLGHRKLQIETRLKLLSKWDPKRYGDKMDLNHGTQPDNPLTALIARISASATSTLPIVKHPTPDSDDD